MISYAGISLFLFGNKLEKGDLVNAGGIVNEFEIAVKQGALVIPVGATGYVAKDLWVKVMGDYENYFQTKNYQDEFNALADVKLTPVELIAAIVNFLHLVTKQ